MSCVLLTLRCIRTDQGATFTPEQDEPLLVVGPLRALSLFEGELMYDSGARSVVCFPGDSRDYGVKETPAEIQKLVLESMRAAGRPA